MARATEIVEVKRIVVSVGGKDLSLSVEEARDLYRVLGDLVGPKDAAPLIVREVILSPPPVPMIVPYVPYQPSTTPMYRSVSGSVTVPVRPPRTSTSAPMMFRSKVL